MTEAEQRERQAAINARAFKETFGTENGARVLAHMRWFCGGSVVQSPFDENALGMARMVGRLEAYREMQRFAAIPDERLDAAARRVSELREDDG